MLFDSLTSFVEEDGSTSSLCSCVLSDEAIMGGSNACDQIFGCMTSGYENYNYEANQYMGDGCIDNGIDICECVPFSGCTDPTATNYTDFGSSSIVIDDGSCEYILGCMDESADNFNPEATQPDDSCEFWGCNESGATNYDDTSTGCEDGTTGCCVFPVVGCMDDTYMEYNPEAEVADQGLCINLIIYGCTNPNAFNYNPEANINDDSCEEVVYGCIDSTAVNFNADANVGEGDGCIVSIPEIDFEGNQCECIYPIYGCTDPYMFNYNPDANENAVSADDPSDPCEPFIYGCMDPEATNYDEEGNIDFQGLLCTYTVEGCTDPSSLNFDLLANVDDGSCIPGVDGCMDPEACDYNPEANFDLIELNYGIENGSCVYPPTPFTNCDNTCVEGYGDFGDGCEEIVLGCTDNTAFNYDENANTDDGSCNPEITGCMDSSAYNYDPEANSEGYCIEGIPGCTDPSAVNYNCNSDGLCYNEYEGDNLANIDDGSCYYNPGCTDPEACNYDLNADFSENDTCEYAGVNEDCNGNCLEGYIETPNTYQCVEINEGCGDSYALNAGTVGWQMGADFNVENNDLCEYPLLEELLGNTYFISPDGYTVYRFAGSNYSYINVFEKNVEWECWKDISGTGWPEAQNVTQWDYNLLDTVSENNIVIQTLDIENVGVIEAHFTNDYNDVVLIIDGEEWNKSGLLNFCLYGCMDEESPNYNPDATAYEEGLTELDYCEYTDNEQQSITPGSEGCEETPWIKCDKINQLDTYARLKFCTKCEDPNLSSWLEVPMGPQGTLDSSYCCCCDSKIPPNFGDESKSKFG
jgi:hypothetical protein